jgi:hypothetical protein
MKKVIVFSTVIFLCVLTSLHAQSLKFGVTGGLNFAQLNFDDFENQTENIELESISDRSTGYHVGVVGQAGLFSFFVQPSLLFTNTKAQVSLLDDGVESTEELSFNRFDVPLLVGKKFAGIIKVMLGPVASFQLSSDSPLAEVVGLNEEYNSATFGYQAGVGLEAANLFVDFKFEGSLSSLGDGVTLNDQDYNFDSRMNQMVLSVGFLF